MWGETRGWWEGLPVGKFLEQVSKFWFFLRFSAMYRFWNFGFFCGFPPFSGNPKKSQNADFSAVAWDFEGLACPKNSSGFSRDEQGSKSGFSRSVPQFFGDPKNSWNVVFPRFLGISKDGLVQNFLELRPQFSWDFKVLDQPKKISEPANLSAVFLGNSKRWTHPKI